MGFTGQLGGRGLLVTKLPDRAWGEPRVGRIIPRADSSWGFYEFLVGTPWEPLIPAIPAGVWDAAVRGHATPLMRLLGPPPAALARRLPVASSRCRQREHCVNAGPECIPGPRVPECWESPDLDVPLMSALVGTWRAGVVVVRTVP